MIKARPVAGDAWVGEQFLQTITPFVYRKYLDYTSIEESKERKDRGALASARARRHARDLKLGVGGIREIEFFAQAHQLIYGGKNPDLRRRGTVETLRALVGAGIVSRRECDMLEKAYTFLRSLEHRIQVYQDRQTHALPEREADLLRLARTMGLPDVRALTAAMDRHTGNVRAIYDSLFRAAPEEAGPEVSPDVQAVLYPESEEEDIGDRLSALGCAEPGVAWLVRLFGSSRFLSGYLLRYPELLDTFLRKDFPPLVKTKSDLRRELGETLAACADYEQELGELRRFQNQEMLRVGVTAPARR